MSVNTKVNGELVKSAGLYKVSVPIQSGDIYSFEERQVGVWADGKPLYQRVFDLGSDVSITNNTFTNTTIDASTMETLVNAKAIYSTGVTIYQVMANINNGIIRLQADRNDNVITVRYVILQYTKTTDVAGSGEYVPSGDKAVHYSTDEEVIGTFMGETLYRKTVNFGALPNNTTKNVAHGISNLKYIKSYEGTAYNSTNKYFLSLPYLHASVANNYIEIYFNDTNISIVTKTDRTPYDVCYVTLEYTKTS